MVAPKIALNNISTIKIKKIVLAIDAAPDAMPVKPKMAATIAITKKMAVHFNIIYSFKVDFLFFPGLGNNCHNDYHQQDYQEDANPHAGFEDIYYKTAGTEPR